MKNERQQYFEEEFAKDEPPVTANEFLAEIQPLLGDYFIGEVSLDANGIVYCLPNGQKFILKAFAA